MPGDGVVGQNTEAFHIAARRKILKRADAQVARCHAGQDAAREHAFAHDALAGQDRRERAGRRDSKRSHRLADDVFADDRTERRPAVTAP